MPDFVGTFGTAVSPWGVNEFLRSTDDFGTESYTAYAGAFQVYSRDGNPMQRELKAGTVMAKITSGPGIGKVGPFQSTVGTAEVQTITPSGTWAGATGSYQLSAANSANPLDTIAVPVATTNAQLQALIRAMPAYAPYLPTVTGGPIGTGAFTITYSGGAFDADVPQITFGIGSITGGTSPSAVGATSTAGVAGDATDGRQTLANIVGLALTTVPWQLVDRDVEISCVYDAEVIQGWCFEYDLNGNLVPLSNTTAAAMQRGGAAGKMVDIGFH